VTGDGIRLRILPALILSAVALLAGTVGVATAQQRPARPGARRARRAGPRIGRPAPDFELPLLEATTNKAGQTVARVTDKKIRLSSFRGKKVVCLFLSSYT